MISRVDISNYGGLEMNKDYSHSEINGICQTLLGIHRDKLKNEEITFIENRCIENLTKEIKQADRDILIGMYDRFGGEWA